MDFAAVAFRRTLRWRGREVHHGLSFFGSFAASFFALVGFAVERLRYWRGAADVAQQQDFDLEVSAFGTDLQRFSDSDFTGRLGRLMIRFDST